MDLARMLRISSHYQEMQTEPQSPQGPSYPRKQKMGSVRMWRNQTPHIPLAKCYKNYSGSPSNNRSSLSPNNPTSKQITKGIKSWAFKRYCSVHYNIICSIQEMETAHFHWQIAEENVALPIIKHWPLKRNPIMWSVWMSPDAMLQMQ